MSLVEEFKNGDFPDCTWQQANIRVKDKEKSLAFYRDVMGMTLIDTYDFPKWEFSLFFLATLPPGEEYSLEPGSDEAHKYLWSMNGTCIELTYNYGTEKNEDFHYHPGNQEKDGFGHFAFSCNNVYDACEILEKSGISFKKKPDEGRMKGLAFVHDPDQYWMEIIKMGSKADKKQKLEHVPNKAYHFAQTMLRIKDPEKSIPFYTEKLDMTLVDERHFSDFSLYFLATLPKSVQSRIPDPKSEKASEFVRSKLYTAAVPVLELTHNHGTEKDENFVHYNGNAEPRRGFGHIGFLVSDVYKTCESFEKEGLKFHKKPDEGGIKGYGPLDYTIYIKHLILLHCLRVAFLLDPDGYWIELVGRGRDVNLV
eukprot:CAMPEP_0204823080 /NCGR_PEP_ID=MMETSP1346-20131115/1222_1 /ASSEMBLY_ACC=CAM_ASM_000771 /TAXON_ID=215587 /ORGANISM="Aplanochytrium stocchinoi, Strain GSBS06" /LENGTH=366 /DNA_ID=CAMNT_0051949613 /DNA_START=156 /DNA_END=1256 /DNA_ORIENTATION=-